MEFKKILSLCNNEIMFKFIQIMINLQLKRRIIMGDGLLGYSGTPKHLNLEKQLNKLPAKRSNNVKITAKKETDQ
jgi:hypothetical protein